MWRRRSRTGWRPCVTRCSPSSAVRIGSPPDPPRSKEHDPVALDPQLLDILACPDTHHAPLEHDAEAQTLTCTECGRVFEIRDDIPVLLLDEARPPASGGAS